MRNRQHGVTLIEIMIVVAILALVVVGIFGARGCSHPTDEAAIRSAEDHGFTDVTVRDRHDYSPGWNGCGEDDAVAFDMSGKNPAGRYVDFTLCCGTTWGNGKGCTVRIK